MTTRIEPSGKSASTPTQPRPEQRPSEARERLLAAASRLFYARGIPHVGINEVIAKADIARMTLYHHFASKDDLVMAVLERRIHERERQLAEALSRARSPHGEIDAMFDYLETLCRQPLFRGCAFINAAVEHGQEHEATRTLVAKHKQSTADRFEAIARGAGWRHPAELAAELLLLWDGATIGAYLSGNTRSVAVAKKAARALIRAAKEER